MDTGRADRAGRTVALPDGERVPALGQGTWMMGAADSRGEEAAALRLGVELELTLIDTAEVYGDGAAEILVGEALHDRRDDLFLVSKVAPDNAVGARLEAACEASLRRLRTDRIDLYLLHWRGGVDLARMVDGMEALQQAGRIRHWGVSNFDVADMEALLAAGGQGCVTNQVYYGLTSRGPEFSLLPWMAARSMPLMAYSPVEKGRVLASEALNAIARRSGATPAQLALAWALRDRHTIALPKAAQPAHVRDNAAALALNLEPELLAELDAAYPAPTRKMPLQLL